jgi:hypothetical protein
MKSCKIWRLVLGSDKNEAGDRKRKVMHIHFGHSMMKNSLGESCPWEAAMSGP